MKKIYREIADLYHALYIFYNRLALYHDQPEEVKSIHEQISKTESLIVELKVEVYL